METEDTPYTLKTGHSSEFGAVAPAASEPASKMARWGLLLAFVAGLALAGGLVYGGMTQPKRVIAFLNISTITQGSFPGRWNARVGVVLLCAMLTMLLAYWITVRPGRKPWLASRFVLPIRTSIDFKLVVGATLFGIGWGMAGYDPGAAVASLLTGSTDAVIFVGTMCLGMLFATRFSR